MRILKFCILFLVFLQVKASGAEKPHDCYAKFINRLLFEENFENSENKKRMDLFLQKLESGAPKKDLQKDMQWLADWLKSKGVGLRYDPETLKIEILPTGKHRFNAFARSLKEKKGVDAVFYDPVKLKRNDAGAAVSTKIDLNDQLGVYFLNEVEIYVSNKMTWSGKIGSTEAHEAAHVHMDSSYSHSSQKAQPWDGVMQGKIKAKNKVKSDFPQLNFKDFKINLKEQNKGYANYLSFQELPAYSRDLHERLLKAMRLLKLKRTIDSNLYSKLFSTNLNLLSLSEKVKVNLEALLKDIDTVSVDFFKMKKSEREITEMAHFVHDGVTYDIPIVSRHGLTHAEKLTLLKEEVKKIKALAEDISLVAQVNDLLLISKNAESITQKDIERLLKFSPRTLTKPGETNYKPLTMDMLLTGFENKMIKKVLLLKKIDRVLYPAAAVSAGYGIYSIYEYHFSTFENKYIPHEETEATSGIVIDTSSIKEKIEAQKKLLKLLEEKKTYKIKKVMVWKNNKPKTVEMNPESFLDDGFLERLFSEGFDKVLFYTNKNGHFVEIKPTLPLSEGKYKITFAQGKRNISFDWNPNVPENKYLIYQFSEKGIFLSKKQEQDTNAPKDVFLVPFE